MPQGVERAGVAFWKAENSDYQERSGIPELLRAMISPCGDYMAQIAQKRLYFTIGASSATENDATDLYLDIPAALSAVNRKQYHQFTRSGEPLCYTVTVTNIASGKPIVYVTAPNTWTTSNAAKKTAVGWKKQLKNSGIRMSELPTYAKRFRCAFDVGAIPSGAGAQNLQNHLVPDAGPAEGAAGGTRLFTPYTDPLGGADITYFNSNEISLLALEDAGAEYKPVLLGVSTADDFGMIFEYLKSRRNMREASDPTSEFPDDDGLMNTLYADSEVLADEVTAAVSEYNTFRPYSEGNADEAVLGAIVESDTTNYRETFAVPLGLLKVTGVFGLTDGDQFIVDVEAMYEM